MINSVIHILSGLLIIMSLLPLLRMEHWCVRLGDFPRLQILAFIVATLAAQLIFYSFESAWEWVLTGLLLACLAYQAWWIVRYTRLMPVEVKSASGCAEDAQVSILTSNVLMTNRDSERLRELVTQYQPDILVTLESDKWWEQQLQPLERDYPYSVKCPLDNLYGMHVYSKLELWEPMVDYLVEDDKPSVHAAIQLRCGQWVQFRFLHPAPPSPTENEESSERDAELLVVARKLKGGNSPTIVTGDLNDVAWSKTTRTFRKISGLLDPRIGRGMFNTFHADYWFLRWPLDHLFHSDHFQLVEMHRLPSVGSDHFPLFTRLAYCPQEKREQDGIEPDQDDRQWAREKTADEGVTPADVPDVKAPNRTLL